MGPNSPNAVSMLQTLKSRFHWDIIILLDSSYDSKENEVLFVKIGARVLELWLDMWFEPKWPRCSFEPQSPKSRTFLKYHNAIGFIFWFWRKWGPVWTQKTYPALSSENLWLDTSSGLKWPKCSYLVPDPKVKNFFENFITREWILASHFTNCEAHFSNCKVIL